MSALRVAIKNVVEGKLFLDINLPHPLSRYAISSMRCFADTARVANTIAPLPPRTSSTQGSARCSADTARVALNCLGVQ